MILSTLVIGGGFWLLTGTALAAALVFGANVTPSDPVAVLGVLKAAGVTKDLETKIASGSLFNDGVAYVVFLFLVAIAFPLMDAHGEGGHVPGLADGARGKALSWRRWGR